MLRELNYLDRNVVAHIELVVKWKWHVRETNRAVVHLI